MEKQVIRNEGIIYTKFISDIDAFVNQDENIGISIYSISESNIIFQTERSITKDAFEAFSAKLLVHLKKVRCMKEPNNGILSDGQIGLIKHALGYWYGKEGFEGSYTITRNFYATRTPCLAFEDLVEKGLAYKQPSSINCDETVYRVTAAGIKQLSLICGVSFAFEFKEDELF